jgi:hypothetical protein
MLCTVHFIITLFNVGNVLLCVIYQLNLPYLCTLNEYRVIYSVRYYPRFHVTAVGHGMYYPQIQGNYCTLCWIEKGSIQDMGVTHHPITTAKR